MHLFQFERDVRLRYSGELSNSEDATPYCVLDPVLFAPVRGLAAARKRARELRSPGVSVRNRLLHFQFREERPGLGLRWQSHPPPRARSSQVALARGDQPFERNRLAEPPVLC